MDTSALKKFGQEARRQLIKQVTARMDHVLSMDSAEIREKEKAVNELNEQIHNTSKKAVIDRVAYIWFNRFCALRFMDVNRYTNIGTVSPLEGFSQPEILQEAKQGHIHEDLDRFVDRHKVYDLLSGKIPSSDPQQEAYRLLLVGVCNSYHILMPFMFERIVDYTELLMPEDLLSQNSILQAVRDALTEDNCKDVEVIGWLYQFYISEKKDEVIDGLKKNIKITPENIPAATQIFTPHWIVQYIVENSLGRLWMLNHPKSRLTDQMAYYIKPEQEEKDFLRINSLEELKICDTACGSGHMLAYVFDILYFIYEEEGYDASDIPHLILENNLYGIEIDERAGELAAFCLFMKAREKYKRFFRKPTQPNICVLENIEFTDDELEQYMDKIGRDLFTIPLLKTLNQFNEADNFGSLIRPELTDIDHIRRVIEEKDMSGQLFFYKTHEKVLKVLEQTDYLRSKYHVVVANPPYMGSKGMNPRLKSLLQDNYTDVKSDLFSAFIIRNLDLSVSRAQLGFMSPFVWMFISTYEKLRNKLIESETITSLIQLEYSGFEGATVPICTFTLEHFHQPDFKGGYIKLSNFRGANNQAPKTLEAIQNSNCGWFFRASTSEFKKIPESPIAYWLGPQMLELFNEKTIDENFDVGSGLSTSDNDRFVRYIWEVANNNIATKVSSCDDCLLLSEKWFLFQKGGEYRKWFGNMLHVVNWKNNGEELKNWVINNPNDPNTTHWSRRIFNTELYFKKGITWSTISSGKISFRLSEEGTMISNAAGGIFSFQNDNMLHGLIAGLNCNAWSLLFSIINPTLNYSAGIVQKAPTPVIDKSFNSYRLITTAKQDWDSCETSMNFKKIHLLRVCEKHSDDNTRNESAGKHSNHSFLPITYKQLHKKWSENILEMKRLEDENNRIFIEAYGLQDELTPDVPLEEITLTCNPHYRYNGNKTEKELDALLLADTMKEFISYAVGCMFGRYSLYKPGLILANQGETIEDYKRQVPTPTFVPDEDNVVPILDGDWFIDDIADRFRSFLHVTFGEEHYEENLKFLEQATGKDIRKYFLKDFYDHHIKMYKKRPIYWMFSSPKGSFNALIYMHRYRPDTVSVVLNNYLREFRSKITAKKENLEEISSSSSSSQSDKTKALKEIEKLKKVINELEDYERGVLYPLATQQIEIDLDDGVKVNYNKFGNALKKVAGLTD